VRTRLQGDVVSASRSLHVQPADHSTYDLQEQTSPSWQSPNNTQYMWQTDRQTVAITYFIAAGFDESVSHHWQTDRQTDSSNKVLYSCRLWWKCRPSLVSCCCNMKWWDQQHHSSVGKSPYECLHRHTYRERYTYIHTDTQIHRCTEINTVAYTLLHWLQLGYIHQLHSADSVYITQLHWVRDHLNGFLSSLHINTHLLAMLRHLVQTSCFQSNY